MKANGKHFLGILSGPSAYVCKKRGEDDLMEALRAKVGGTIHMNGIERVFYPGQWLVTALKPGDNRQWLLSDADFHAQFSIVHKATAAKRGEHAEE